MLIAGATLTVTDLAAAATYYAGVLGLPVSRHDDRAEVTLGASTLVLRAGASYAGEHHLAFGVAPEDFDAVLAFAREHLAPISAGGCDVIDGPDGWDSRSVYFRGPEGIVLEYIAREAHRCRLDPAATGPPARPRAGPPRVICLSEVGIGVADVQATVGQLGDVLGLPPFPPQSADFAPVGDHDGLLILVAPDRTWFPTDDASAARGPLSVSLAADGGRPVDLRLNDQTTLRRT